MTYHFLNFLPIDEETPLNRMRRATMGYDSGLLSENQALHIVGLKTDNGERKTGGSSLKGEMPRENPPKMNPKRGD